MPHYVASDLGLHCLPVTFYWFPSKSGFKKNLLLFLYKFITRTAGKNENGTVASLQTCLYTLEQVYTKGNENILRLLKGQRLLVLQENTKTAIKEINIPMTVSYFKMQLFLCLMIPLIYMKLRDM